MEQTYKADRREQLLEVTIDLIATEGIAAVTHRRVAELAGVPLGSTTYYFSSRDDMLLQSLRHFGEQEAAQIRDRFAAPVRQPRSARACADLVVDLVAPQTGADRTRTVAQFALLTEAARRVELAPVVRRWNADWRDALAALFRGLAAPSPELEARALLALVDGLLLSQLAAPEPHFVTAILKPAVRRAFDRGADS